MELVKINPSDMKETQSSLSQLYHKSVNVKKPKSPIKPIESHVSKTKKPMGDFYGTGVIQKQGTMRGAQVGTNPLSKNQLKKPPKSLA